MVSGVVSMAHAYLMAHEKVEMRQRCTKVPLPDRKTARRIATQTIAKPGLVGSGGLALPTAYRCPFCGAWHVGHLARKG